MSYIRNIALLMIITGILAIGSGVFAEVVLLKDGNKYIGTVEDQGDKIKITNQDGTISVAKDRIKAIYKDSGVILKETYDILAKAQEMVAGANKIQDGKERNDVLDKAIEMLNGAHDTCDSIVDAYPAREQDLFYKRIKEINETIKHAKFLKVSNQETPPPPPPVTPETEKPEPTPKEPDKPQIDQKKMEEAQAFFENGVDTFNAKKYDEARNCFSNAISCNPEYAEAYGKLGDTLETLKEEELAYENYKRCIEIIKNMEEPSPAQTILLNEIIKKTEKFRALEDKTDSLSKDFTTKLLALASQCMTDTDYALAEEIFSLILQVDEKNEEASKGLENVRAELEKAKSAEEEPGKEENTQLAESYYKVGLTQMEQKDYEAAITKFKKALAYRAGYPEAWFKLGEAYEKNNQPREALNSYRKCQRLLNEKTPPGKEDEQLLSQVLRRLDQLDVNGKRLVGIKNNYTSELFKLANQCVTKKYVRFACRILNRIVEIDPANKNAQELLAKLSDTKVSPEPDKKAPSAADPAAFAKHFDNGRSCLSHGQIDEAIAEYTKAIKLNPNSSEAHTSRGVAYNKKAQNEQNPEKKKKLQDKAIEDYTKAIKLNPKATDAYNNRGNTYADKGDIDRAMADMNQAIMINPKAVDAPRYGNMGLLCAQKGDYKTAIMYMEMYLKIEPNHPGAPTARQLIAEWKSKIK
ncbi:MAG: tetratricopeptide repeat protein [Planctomycetota bacterium]